MSHGPPSRAARPEPLRAWISLGLGLLLIGLPLLVVAADGDRASRPSIIAPLAPKSLLLGASLAGERVVVVGERGHVLLSDDRGGSWRQVVVPTRSTLNAVHFPSNERGFAVGHDAVILATQDGGESWTLQYDDPELESPLLDVFFASPDRGFAVGAYGLFLETRDGGKSWSSRAISDGDMHYNAIEATDDGRLFVAGERGSLLRSDDGGETWQALSTPNPASLFGALRLPEGGLLVFGLQGRAFRTDDAGETWQILETDTQASLMGGAVTSGGDIVLGGITGVVLLGRVDDTRLVPTQRPDRKAVSSAAALPDDGLLLLGAFGVADASELLGLAAEAR